MSENYQLEIPEDLKQDLDKYTDKALDMFESYSDYHMNRTPNVDPFDPNYPGVSEEFIKNWDRTSHNFNGESLATHLCGNLYRMRRPGYSVQVKFKDWLESEFPEYKLATVSGHFVYPRNGGYMGWHTNAITPGIRVYIVYAEEDNQSFFRYFDNDSGEVVTSWDKKGWNTRWFNILDSKDNLYWHCVYADCLRFSIGTKLIYKEGDYCSRLGEPFRKLCYKEFK